MKTNGHKRRAAQDFGHGGFRNPTYGAGNGLCTSRRATRIYVEAHGKPVAFYSDKHGIFRVNAKDAMGGDRITQFGRVLSALNIDIICANSPQTKGRIERAFGTLQDRMVKELRLAGISTIAAAGFHHRLQRPLWPGSGECQEPSPAADRDR